MTVLAPAPRVSEDDIVTPRHHILVVDDMPVFRDLLARGLALEGFEVTTAESGPEALVLLATWRPDLILSDVEMPGMTGLELVRILREWDTATPVLFVSGRDSDADKAAGFAAGGDGYLIKPFGWAELVQRVRALLGTRTQLQDQRT
jgi:DNA-binding response OmpR family regulator